MKKVFKQSLICILSVMLSVTMFPVYAFAEGGADPADTAEMIIAELPDEFYSEEEPLDNDELFTLYAESLLYGDTATETPLLRGRNVVPEGLNGIIYSKLKEEVALVADGTNNSTAFELSLTDLGLAGKTWTAKDLGVDAIVSNGAISQEAVRALQASLGVDLNVIMGALLADCPYELYWYDKTVGVSMSGPRIGASYSGSEYVMTLNSGYIFSLAVAQGYSAGEYLVDTSGIERVHHAVDTAASIVNDASSENDYNKLYTYKDAICSRVSYNYDAAYDDSTPYGDPWQLISVFDDDTDTNIVCEGYSKAFQYLCDRTAFDGDINCISVSGYMGGGTGAGAHMWNIVTMEDGRNYLVDVTNCDDGTIGAPDQLFLAGYDSGSKDAGYVFNAGGTGISYTYGNDTLNLYDSELEIAGSDYEYHEWSEWIEVTPATCTEGGLEKRTCSLCGEEQTRVTEALGHDYVVAADTAVDPTCSEAGHEADMVCSRCGDTIYGAEIAPLGHELTKVDAKEATETEEGNIEYWVCETCGKYFADSEGTAEISAESVVVPMVVPPAEISWTLVDGVLKVSGEGWMQDFETASSSPWYSQRANITKVVVSDGLTHIGNRAFYQCSNVTEVEIASSIESIGEWAFNGNTSLVEVKIPASVIVLSNSSFRACSSLEKVTFEGDAPSLGSYVFNGASASLTIHCYENTTGWDGEEWSGLNVSVDHKFSEVTIIKEPTCTEQGESQAVCLICGETITETVPALGHDYIDGYCTRCGDKEIVANGNCGESNSTYTMGSNVRYVLYGDGELVISGSGKMHGWESTSSRRAPWYGLPVKSIVIESGVKDIGSYAFSNCSSLTSITIPESVTSIGYEAFSYCSSLTSITIPESVTSIGGYAFSNCSSLTSITIPESVTSIGRAFSGCSSLTSITIPESVTSIDGAFSGCSSLTSITIPESVTIIDGAFNNCRSLTSITIPESVTSIGNSTFYNCRSLTSITIPESVTSIGNSAFYNCSSLTSITIPESVTSIGNEAFYNCSSLTSITIPESVTSIGHGAFCDCSSLTNIMIPESVTSIGIFAFENCNSLTSITIPESVTSIGNSTFSNCSSLTSITIPESVTSIGYEAFYNCSSLTSITIPESVTSIGEYAFRGCSSLTSITIPFIGGSATSNTNLAYIYGSYQTDTPQLLEEVIITGNITSIGENAFYGFSSLTSITIPETITSIGEDAFYNCSSLTSITIPESVTSIGEYAFRGCSSLTSITIPESVTSIGNSTFSGCSRLTSITIPESVTSIGNSTFYNCSSLTSITIPESVTSIGEYAFAYCRRLTSITIPESVTSIGNGAFAYCSRLTSITIPFIGGSKSENRFIGYIFGASSYTGNSNAVPTSLKEVVIINSTDIPSYAFCDCSRLTSITIPESVTSIGNYAFSNCSRLTSITIPESVTSIGNYAFSECSSLTSITIPESVTSIGENAFCDCGSLTSITIPESVTSIGGHAFSGCSSLINISIPEGVISIGDYAFSGCSSLTNIYVVKDSYADGWLSENGYDDKIKYVYKSGEHYYYETISNPTCVETGLKTITCVICGETITEEIPATGIHIWNEGEITISPTCISSGLKTYTCTVCGGTQTEEIVSLGHDLIHHEAKAPTCESVGWEAFDTCSRCDYTTYEEIAALGHDFIHHESKAPTCTNPGCKEYDTCSRCDYTTYVEIAALGHEFIHHESKAATCTEPGWDEYDTCSRCDYTTYEEIAPLGHEYTNVITKATLTEDGSIKSECSRCGEADPESEPVVISHPVKFTLSATSYTYTGGAKKPGVTIKDADGNIIDAANYSVAYSNNVKIGTATAKVTFKGDYYSGTKSLTFKIRGNLANTATKVTVSKVADKTYTGKVIEPTLNVKAIGTAGTVVTLKSGTDYTLSYSANKNVGKATITITGKGNYTGTKKVTFKINPKGTSLKTLTATSKGFKATWTKQATKMSTSYITGYQIQYSMSSTFASGNTTVTATKYSTVSKTISKLKAKKKYYVRIRTYKTVSGVKYYSPWSAKKYVTTKA